MSFKFQLGQLRHLYMLMVAGDIKDLKQAANGLLAPAIEEFEKIDNDEIYPTRFAYEAACKALESHKNMLNTLKNDNLDLHRTIAIQKQEIKKLQENLQNNKLSSNLYYQWKSGDKDG